MQLHELACDYGMHGESKNADTQLPNVKANQCNAMQSHTRSTIYAYISNCCL